MPRKTQKGFMRCMYKAKAKKTIEPLTGNDDSLIDNGEEIR